MASSGRKVTKTINQDIKTEADRQKALETALAEIEKAFGKGAVMKLGDNSNRENIPVIPTGIISLDVALGAGGIPRGRIIEVYGPEASGKTTVALHIVAETQRLGGICGYIDAEHALDPIYAKKLGVQIDDLYISQPDDGEQALEITEHMVRSSVIDLIVVDSVAALTPRAEIEGHMGDSHMGLHARLMSQALRKLTAFTNKTNCTILFINQLRSNISGYGPAETTTGGRALKFYASVRIDIRKGDPLKVGDNFIGTRTNVKIAKNKVAPPFKSCSFDIVYGSGVSKEGDVLDLAAELTIVTKSGAWYSLGSERMGQGRENAKTYLREHPDALDKLNEEIRSHYNLRKTDVLESLPKPETEKPSSKGKKNKSAKGAAEVEIPLEDVETGDVETVDAETGDAEAEYIEAEYVKEEELAAVYVESEELAAEFMNVEEEYYEEMPDGTDSEFNDINDEFLEEMVFEDEK